LGSAVISACASDEYAAEASFCDDWCHTLRRTRCDQEPENCVRDCERALPSEPCLQHQVLLLDCYRNTPPEGLVCVEQGFQGSIRPMPDICRPERDALVGCAAPRVMACIEACRALDGSDPVLVPEALAAEAFASEDVTAESCPSSPMPCERLCWAIDGAVNDADSGGDAPEALPAVSGGADVDALGAALVSCARQGARSCWERALTAEPADEASWTSSFFACAAPLVSAE
jgi:hypothetical protein